MDAFCHVQLRSGRVAFVRMKVRSAVVMDRSGLDAEAAARRVEGRRLDLRRDAIFDSEAKRTWVSKLVD